MKLILAIIVTALFTSGMHYLLQPEPAKDLARRTLLKEVQPGCILLGPFPQLLKHNFIAHERPRVFLINKKTKKVVQQWSAPFPFFVSKIDNQGNLWGITHKQWDDGVPAEIVRLDKKSNVLQRWPIPNLGEDFDVTSDGRFFVLQRFKGPSKISKKEFVYDRINEIDPQTMESKWSWDTREMGDPEDILNSQQEYSSEIHHTNSLRYITKNPINQKPALLISMRNTSTVALIDYETKKILWTSPAKMLDSQHDARLLENGEILVFNNRRSRSSSTIDQLNVKNNARSWRYLSATEQDFHQAVLGGVQRLENGNTLITEGLRGHIFEINPQKDVVWEYFSQFEVSGRETAWPIAPVFRVEHYSSEFISQLGWGHICD